MHIFRSLDDIQGRLSRVVATIGNFDGVHLGHREIFRRVKRAAAAIGGGSAVITFLPHPLKVVDAGKEVRLINTYAEKETLIGASGLDYLIIIPFSPSFAALSAQDFVRTVLVDKVGVTRLIIGYDYAFGRKREGNTTVLRKLATEFGFEVEVLEPIGEGGAVYSSSAIRRLIAAGDMRGAVPLLGRHYSLGGTVVPGFRRGAAIGYPTANIATEKELLPPPGVYAVKVKVEDIMYDGACNIGNNPTFGNQQTSVEVFLLDFAGDLYGRELRVYFIDRLRDERMFPDLAALKDAIAADVARCREILQGETVIHYDEYLGRE